MKQMRAQGLLLMSLSTLALQLGGCASLVPKLEPPQLAVTHIQIESSGNSSQQELLLTVHAVNPNDRTIAIRSIDAQLDIENMSLAQGSTAAGFTLPAKGDVDFDIDVVANINTAMVALAGSLGHRSVAYRLYGNVHLKGSLLHKIPFDQRGRVKW